MEKMEFLKKSLDRAYHNLLCYSQNYLMNTPKEGYEKEWESQADEVKLINEMIAELETSILFVHIPKKSGVTFKATVGSWGEAIVKKIADRPNIESFKISGEGTITITFYKNDEALLTVM